MNRAFCTIFHEFSAIFRDFFEVEMESGQKIVIFRRSDPNPDKKFWLLCTKNPDKKLAGANFGIIPPKA